MTAQKSKGGRPRKYICPQHYKDLCRERAGEVVTYMKMGWSHSVACRKAGLNWETARKHLLEDDNFRMIYNNILSRPKKQVWE